MNENPTTETHQGQSLNWRHLCLILPLSPLLASCQSLPKQLQDIVPHAKKMVDMVLYHNQDSENTETKTRKTRDKEKIKLRTKPHKATAHEREPSKMEIYLEKEKYQALQLSGLSEGDQGERVGFLQKRLKSVGFYTGTIDQDYGKGTTRAVHLFQKIYNQSVMGQEYSIRESGRVNLETAQALILWAEKIDIQAPISEEENLRNVNTILNTGHFSIKKYRQRTHLLNSMILRVGADYQRFFPGLSTNTNLRTEEENNFIYRKLIKAGKEKRIRDSAHQYGCAIDYRVKSVQYARILRMWAQNRFGKENLHIPNIHHGTDTHFHVGLARHLFAGQRPYTDRQMTQLLKKKKKT